MTKILIGTFFFDNLEGIMNNKNDILNAWITIEQLSEGSIAKEDSRYRTLNLNEMDHLEENFSIFLNKNKKLRNKTDKQFSKSGLVIYFDIFDFQEVIDILREKYNISSTDEETTNSDKFTFALYFDHKLNFIPEKLFFTISGYIRYKNEFPKDFFNAESSLRDDLSKKFEDKEFNRFFTDLLRQYKVNVENCCYGFIEDLEHGDVNLHSFFIDDLEKAKSIETNNFKRYLNGGSGTKINLDSKVESFRFNPESFQEILQPKNYPLGRFPSNSEYSLSLMQQVAVNLALNDKNTIRSVNGPPGTGKTTLLKDIFADLVVQQAVEICELFTKEQKKGAIYWKNARIGYLPRQISDKNMVVASSNNGALKNIVNELPQWEKVSNEFKEKIAEIDYFSNISNSKFNEYWISNKDQEDKTIREIKIEKSDDKNWGCFSLEGGKSDNMSNLLLNIEFITKYLKEEYSDNEPVYKEFTKFYKKVLEERNRVQKCYKEMSRLSLLKSEYEIEKKSYDSERIKKIETINNLAIDFKEQLERLNTEIKNIGNRLKYNQELLDEKELFYTEAKRNIEIIQSQKPRLMWLKKFFKKSEVEYYNQTLDQARSNLCNITDQRNQLKNQINKMVILNDRNKFEKDSKTEQFEITKNTIENGLKQGELKLIRAKKQIDSLSKKIEENNVEPLDFTKTYDELQLSNPWFTKEFRIKQSELFIKALAVKKQFLYENRKNLGAALEIWKRKNEYITKQNGQELLIEAWQWINFAIPVISTTFASFGRMFNFLPENTIANLFIDEAGQALPQASVGAIFRSKKVLAVGDPSQIPPVLTLDSNVLNLIGQYHNVDERFVSAHASTQTLIDETSQYGFYKKDDQWIGIPLWVQRRSSNPMFSISNEISYDGLMVQGKSVEEAVGKAKWIDISGKANDKFVKEQADNLKDKILSYKQLDPKLWDEIYIITPFKNVAYRLAKELAKIGFTKRENNKPVNIGTVHTFQGKEAKIIYFVLGADSSSKGAAKWAVTAPNLMNVAVTRAKEEFYIIGDKQLYKKLNTKVINTTISIIDNHNLS